MTFTAPVLDAPAAEALAWLACARAAGRPCAPVRTLLPAGDIGAAYAVQSVRGLITYEEKETDVNIAIAMLEGAVRDDYDSAMLISGDGDLRPAVAAVKRVRQGKRVIAAFPPRRHSTSLAQAVDGYVSVSTTKVRNAQLPPKTVTAGGIILERPQHWN